MVADRQAEAQPPQLSQPKNQQKRNLMMTKLFKPSFVCLSTLLTIATATHAGEAGYKSWQDSPRPAHVQSYNPGPAPIRQANWFWGLEGGAQRLNGDTTIQNTRTYPYEIDSFSTQKSTGAIIGIEAGRLWQRGTQWFPAFSAAARYRYLFDNNIGNQVTQVSVSQTPAYNYKWNFSSNIFTVQGKLDITHYNQLFPYIGVGLGVASTQAKSYSETPIPPTAARTSPGYASNTNNKFTYNLGAGFDYKFSTQMIWTLGYEYQSLGGVASGFGNEGWSESMLGLGTVTDNVLLLSFSYLFDN